MYFNNIYDNKEDNEKQENINIDEMLEMEKKIIKENLGIN